ncbi:MAG: PAS domain-containing protein [Dehalococcoidales bacterium]|nr:PAS domain-containing protein [Dehalococcoidales bacterium]
MAFNFPPFSLIFLFGSILAIFIACIVWMRRPAPGAVPLTFFMLCIAWWLFARILEAGAIDYSVKVFWGKAEFFGIAGIGILWAFFALDYIGSTWWRRPRNYLLLALLPIAALGVIWTNQFHHSFWTDIYPSGIPSILVWEHGWSFWLFWGCQYIALIYGMHLLWEFVFRKQGIYRRQFILLLTGTMLPLIGNIIYVFGLRPVKGLDLTPFVFVIAGGFYSLSLLRFHFMNPVTIARNKLVENLPDGILVLNAQGIVADINAAGERIINTSREDTIGKPVIRTWSKWPPTIINTTPFEARAEIITESPRGNRYFNVSSTTLRNKQNNIIGKLILLRDISERRESQKLMETLYDKEYKLRHELQQEIEKRDKYVRAIVHELKTPLTAILASGEILEAEINNTTQSSLVSNIRKSSINLENRINELLDLARGEIGTLHIEPKPIDITELIREVESETAPLARSKALGLEVVIPDNLPLVNGDNHRLRWVLLNLLNNAFHYTTEGKVIICAEKYDDYFIQVKVEDTGQGICDDMMPHLFDPYWRNREKDRLSGLGIGLALSKMFIELHEGKIWAENNPQKGASLIFTLPLA